jgi:hypothetical protein
VRKLGVNVPTPLLPARLVGLEGGPGGRRVHEHQRLTVGDAKDEDKRLVGAHGDRCRVADLDPHVGRRVEGNGDRRPTADQDPSMAATPWPAAAVAQARVELDDGLHGAALG